MKPARRDTSAFERDQDTEHRILDAAHAVFLRRGTAGARMQEIAREAGVNQALLHYYFRSKDRLADAVFQRAATGFMPPVIQVLASDTPLEQKVERVVQLEIDHLSRSPLLPAYLISEMHHDPDRARQFMLAVTGLAPEQVRPRVFDTLRRQIDERVRAGTMRPIAPEQFAMSLLSLCIFPFAARAMMMLLTGTDQKGFERLMARRRRELPAFFLGALRP
ncbi:MAG TPA: helix-turn-helix domain-containing protein [Gemmatimonadaceae bacterium]|nr:helix-turn-helix domain-containing protein [Gemmatimonadaceae bacterium]